MSQITRPALSTAIDVSFADNNQKLITESVLRAFLHNLVDSALIELTDVTPAILPTGGATGQVLAKASNADFSVSWVNAAIDQIDTLETITLTNANNAGYAQQRPSGVSDHAIRVNVASSTTDYIANINLDLTGTPTQSTKQLFVFNLPADKHATINVKSGSTIIDTVTNPLGAAGLSMLMVRYDGTAFYTAMRSDGLDATGVVAATYGDASNIPQVAIGADGRITSATQIPAAQLSQKVFRAGPGPSLAPGLLARGANIIPDNETALQMFVNWNSGSFAYLKLRLELMAANGLNTVRLYSGMGFCVTGELTRSQFQTCMGQFIAYANKLGIYVYITAADVYDSLPSTYDPSLIAPIKAEVVAYATFLDQFPNVVAIDIFNEFFYNGGFPSTSGLSFTQRAAIALDWSTAVRAVTNIPITWSLPTTQSNSSSAMWNATAISELAIIAPAIDFVDMHVYYDVVSADLTSYVAALATDRPGGIPLLIGECGMTADNPDATRATRLARTGTIVRDWKLAGGLVWDLINNSDPESNNMGIFHHDYTPYPLALAAVQSWPTALAVATSSSPSDIVINSAITIYGSVTGSDSNDGLSAGSPKTPQGAADYFRDKVILTGVLCIIQLLDSLSYGTPLRPQPFLGGGTVIIRGNVSDNAAVTFELGGTEVCLSVDQPGNYTYQLEHFRMHSGQAFTGPLRINGGNVIIGNGMFFVAEQSSACHIYVSAGGKLTFVDNCSYVVAGGAGQHVYVERTGRAFFGRFNIDFVSAARTFSQFVLMENLSNAEMFTLTGTGIGIVSGSVVGQRWALNNLSLLKAYGGQDPNAYFPGSTTGAADASSKLVIT